MRWDEMKWNEMRWNEMRWDEVKWERMCMSEWTNRWMNRLKLMIMTHVIETARTCEFWRRRIIRTAFSGCSCLCTWWGGSWFWCAHHWRWYTHTPPLFYSSHISPSHVHIPYNVVILSKVSNSGPIGLVTLLVARACGATTIIVTG
jgi:hypothetical protein